MQGTIDYNLITLIDPPSTYPPSAFDINNQIQAKFYSECLRFLKTQKKFYQCSKQVQERLSHSIMGSVTLDQTIRERSAKLEKISRQLKKINTNYNQAEQKQEFLASICKFINMQQARKIMLQPKIADEAEFIDKLRQIDLISQQLANLNTDLKIIVQIKEQVSLLLQETADKMIKGNISDSLIKRITSDFCEPFLRDPAIANVFITNLTNHRMNLFRIGLNPLINNINYVQNVAQLYEKITQQWLRMLDEEIKIFQREEAPKEIRNITKQVMSKLISELMPKIERGVYKIKSLVDISRVRNCMLKLKNKLDSCGQGTWDLLSKLLVKMLIILQEKLEQGAQQLQIAKYNIYSLVSYVPIRQHLEIIKEAKQYDPLNKEIGWERGFKRLADSRDPSKQPNNKSLIIFNSNIWYLYTHVMKQDGQMIERAEKMVKDCINSIINLNLIGLKKEYEPKTLSKLLDLCADPQSAKKTLYSEVNLLGHQRLRTKVQKQLVTKFTEQIYVPMLKHLNLENGLESSQVAQLAKTEKLNINKYGKAAEGLRVFTADEIKQFMS